MFKSYLHIAARHLTRHRLYALTNVGGLAVGLAGCMLMAIWVLGQLETDRFHEHGECIYRVVTQGEKAARLTTPAVLGSSLQREATEVEAVVRMLNVDNPMPLVSHGEKRFYEDAFHFADPEILKVFTLPLVAGDAATALDEPFTVLLSESAAHKLFGDADPMGQVILFKDYLDLKVTGILRDLPDQSHLQIEFLAYFGMAAWVEQFSERAEVGAAPFVVAVAAALVAAWVSVAYHAIRTSRIDPVEALRCE